MQRNSTTKKKGLVAVQARIEPELVEQIDRECRTKGHCSRAVILRMALLDRYQAHPSSEVA